MFLDSLLNSSQQIEARFAKHLYQFYKSFEFRSLWNVNKKMAKFQRRAVMAAKGTAKLQGVLELTKALREINELENKGRQCFTKFRQSVRVLGWSFDNVKDEVVRYRVILLINKLHTAIDISFYKITETLRAL